MSEYNNSKTDNVLPFVGIKKRNLLCLILSENLTCGHRHGGVEVVDLVAKGYVVPTYRVESSFQKSR